MKIMLIMSYYYTPQINKCMYYINISWKNCSENIGPCKEYGPRDSQPNLRNSSDLSTLMKEVYSHVLG